MITIAFFNTCVFEKYFTEVQAVKKKFLVWFWKIVGEVNRPYEFKSI